MEALHNLREKFVHDTMDYWWRDSNSINILITGKTGTGKSTLANAILGKTVAKVGETLRPETTQVTSFQDNIDGIEVVVWDSPGLQDGLNNEAAYLQDIEARCKDKIDLFIYCVSMQNTRFVQGNRDIAAMCKLTKKLGKEIWNNAVFVLTCANQYITKTKSNMPKSDDINIKMKEKFDEKLEEWKIEIKKCLLETLHLPPESIEKMPILPAGHKDIPVMLKGYPDSPWLSKLWIESLLVTKHSAQPALIKMNLQRLASTSDIHSERDFLDLLSKEKIVIEEKAVTTGREMGMAEVAGRAVGKMSGIRACLSHILERIFGSRSTFTITVDEFVAWIIIELHL